MKKTISILVLVLAFNLSNAQGTFKFTKTVDDMTNKVSYLQNNTFMLSNATKTIGFSISSHLDTKTNTIKDLIIHSVGIGNCVENSTCIILLENGTKVELSSWNKFNCDGTNYMSLTEKNLELLYSSPIAKWRFTNGRTYDSFTGETTAENKFYFKDMIDSSKEITL